MVRSSGQPSPMQSLRDPGCWSRGIAIFSFCSYFGGISIPTRCTTITYMFSFSQFPQLPGNIVSSSACLDHNCLTQNCVIQNSPSQACLERIQLWTRLSSFPSYQRFCGTYLYSSLLSIFEKSLPAAFTSDIVSI